MHKIVWTMRAQNHMKAAYNHISEDSVLNARRMVEDIIAAVEKAVESPEIYPQDKYKINNDGSYRSFVKHRYRVSYRAVDGIMRVLYVRHTSRKDKFY